MGIRSKVLLTVILVGLLVGALVLKVENKSLFKGQIFEGGEQTDVALPDLKAGLEVILPETAEGDISIEAEIENIGEGTLSSGQSFEYTVLIDGTEVFSNSDSYSMLEPGDAFSFVYPIPRSIYQYENEGVVEFVVDNENSIEESDEENNTAEVEYSF